MTQSQSDTLYARIEKKVAAINADIWDALNIGGNPFTSHAFLSAMEESGSVGKGSGWSPLPIMISGPDDRPAAILPAYLKGHSQGEYVFDQGWAQAYERAGGQYYPKLQIAVPFSPVSGPRILFQDAQYALPLLKAAENFITQNGLSSAHASFVEEGQLDFFRDAGWLIRQDIQFHWYNKNYTDFDDFLSALSSRKRKNIRKERRIANENVEVKLLRGAEILPHHMDAFWIFYQDTGARKWGTPYLTRAAFDLLLEKMGNQIILIMAFNENGMAVAGALNLLGADCLYGRYWGCAEHLDHLHFELCYYRPIIFAIEHGLTRVEAGAQGAHKLARGYLPCPTYSAHFIADKGFRDAVAQFLEQEQSAVEDEREFLTQLGPFKRGPDNI
ncbi:GNAT family N-acetyltransferase [Sphingorhabdus lutea]|uniref:GNAT family N-acetyltransferase n=1 Tax=Sphingorhabdus lutea TaxID=1913578 RepID=A0A1L3J9E5_9SPHN|nr:GNAT family N-acetyltransferase [Sphingorhabdus lutea]APG61731.1 GNAT family N-acetyltransferase [Sphingorhabdus lutea]